MESTYNGARNTPKEMMLPIKTNPKRNTHQYTCEKIVSNNNFSLAHLIFFGVA